MLKTHIFQKIQYGDQKTKWRKNKVVAIDGPNHPLSIDIYMLWVLSLRKLLNFLHKFFCGAIWKFLFKMSIKCDFRSQNIIL